MQSVPCPGEHPSTPARSCLPCPPGRLAPPGTAGQHATGFALCPPLWMNSFHRGASREMRGEISPGQHRAGPSLSGECSVAQGAQLPAPPLLPHRRDGSVPPAGFHLARWATPRSEALAKAGEPENAATANVEESPATAHSKATVRTGTRPPDLHGQQR